MTPGEQFGVALPGGTSVSHVRVYDTVGPDGLAGGSPHLHTVCTEAYLVIAGEGAVHTLSGEGYAETPLVTGTIAWFSPGTIHRLINLDGRLELYVLMSNAGLPEAGDMILAFEPDLLADEATYRGLADLPVDGRTTDDAPDAAMRRRERGRHWLRSLAVGGRGAGPGGARDLVSPRRRAARRPAGRLARPPRRRSGHRPRAVARPGGGALVARPRTCRRPPRRIGDPLALAAARNSQHGLLRNPRHRHPLTRRPTATTDVCVALWVTRSTRNATRTG